MNWFLFPKLLVIYEFSCKFSKAWASFTIERWADVEREVSLVIAFDGEKKKIAYFWCFAIYFTIQRWTFSFPCMIMKSCGHQRKNYNFCGFFRPELWLFSRIECAVNREGNVSRGSSINFILRTDHSHFCSVSLSYRIIHTF